jgi:putative ABC transport system permease protein
MRSMDRLTVRLRALFRRSRVERDLDAELRFHFDQQVEEYRAAGMTEADARATATAAVGRLTSIREQCRDALGLRLFDELRQDLRYAGRTLIRTPSVSIIMILTLALGIGANTALFSVVYGLLVRPLPYRDADRLVQFYTERDFSGRARPVPTNFSLVNLEQWRQVPRSLESVALVASSRGAVSFDSGSEAVGVATVTGDFFSTLGGRTVVGRPLAATDDQSPLVVISEGLWRRRFGASPSAVGSRLILDAQPYTIVGVLDAAFQLPDPLTEVWRTAGFARALNPVIGAQGAGGYIALARLRPGASAKDATADGAAVIRVLAAADPRNAGTRVNAVSLRDQLVAQVKPAVLILFAAVGLVLFVACANVANLLLARHAARAREQAIRRALGASRGRLARQALVSSAVIAAAGAALGIAAATALVILFTHSDGAAIPEVNAVHVDGPVLLYALGVTVLTTLAVGVLPALRWSDVAITLRAGTNRVGGGSWHRVRQALIVSELAVAAALLVGAMLLGRSLSRLMTTDIGISADHVTAAEVLAFRGDSSFAERRDVIDRLVARIRSLPGVVSAGAGVALPPNRGRLRFTMNRFDDAVGKPTNYLVDAVTATPDYFSTLGFRLREGRLFTATDDADHPQVMIVSAMTARQVFGAADPIGRSITLPILADAPNSPADHAPVTVVGVVDDVKYSGLDVPADGVIYRPFAQQPFPQMFLVARTPKDVAGMEDAVRRAIADVDRSIVVYFVNTVPGLVSEATVLPRFRTTVLAALAGLTAALAAIGLYGVVAYMVAQRTSEIGIRMALGAGVGDVMLMVLRQGMLLAAAGMTIGLLAARALAGILRSMLYGVEPTDGASFAFAGVLLVAVTLLASYIPARRAARVDPLVALRCE